LIAKGDKDLAGRVAGAILSLLTLIVSLIVLAGVAATPHFIDLVAPGFTGAKRDLTIQLVRIVFPGTGLLVISAWCLGILNSHHKFFLSYVAPVISNLSTIVILILFRHEKDQAQLAHLAAWSFVAGALLQLLVQLPTVISLAPRIKIALGLKLESVRTVIRNFVPVVFSRGIIQLSAFIDSILASFLPSGAVAVLGYAQAIYMLPISLFGMSVSAAELPTMSQAFGNADFKATIQKRINSACRKIAYFVIPSVAGFLFLGDIVAGLLFQSGEFNSTTSRYVWIVLGGSAVGLLASTLGRLYSSAFYSLRDTRTPLKFSIIRVILTTVLGYFMGLKLPTLLGLEGYWGTAGLTASAGIAGWVEFVLLRRALNKVVGPSGLPLTLVAKLWVAALVGGGAGLFVKASLEPLHPVYRGGVIVALFGVVYFPLTALLGVEEAKFVLKYFKRK
jgi:putative peptidoglycan lipid II flippase